MAAQAFLLIASFLWYCSFPGKATGIGTGTINQQRPFARHGKC